MGLGETQVAPRLLIVKVGLDPHRFPAIGVIRVGWLGTEPNSAYYCVTMGAGTLTIRL